MRLTQAIIVLFGVSLATAAAQPAGRPKLLGVEVTRPNIVVHGAYLSRVEIWAVPTGTGITPNEFVLLGKATRSNAVGPKEVWLFRIPSCAIDTRLLATEIFVRAFDVTGVSIGKKSLPFEGASAIHEALCGTR
jgi:hypothetical protein